MTRIGEDEYELIKELLANGCSYREIMNKSMRSTAVIARVRRSNNYEEYINSVKHRNLAYKRVERDRAQRKIDNATFKVMKAALDKGFTISEMMTVFDIGHSTVERIRKTNTFEEYKALLAEKAAAEHRSTVVREQFEIVKDILGQILDRLDAIEKQNKRGWFK